MKTCVSSSLGAPLCAREWISRKSNVPVYWNTGITRSVRNIQKLVGDTPAEITVLRH